MFRGASGRRCEFSLLSIIDCYEIGVIPEKAELLSGIVVEKMPEIHR